MSRAAVVVPVALLLLSGCVSPSRTAGDYRAKAARTADAVVSSLRTAELAARAAKEHDAPATYLSVLLGRAEEDVGAVQGTFDSVQPPDASSDRLRAEVDDLLTEALDELSAMRITVRRGEVDRLPALGRRLGPTADRLEKLSERVG